MRHGVGLTIGFGLLVSLLFPASAFAAPAQWIAVKNGKLPTNSVIGGSIPGRKFAVCRSQFQNGKHIGKVAKGVCSFGWGWKEQKATKDFEVLVAPAPSIKWVPAKGSKPPKGSLVGGANDQRVCRAKHKEGTYPGKTYKGKCNIPYRGKEVAKAPFDYLVVTAEKPAEKPSQTLKSLSELPFDAKNLKKTVEGNLLSRIPLVGSDLVSQIATIFAANSQAKWAEYENYYGTRLTWKQKHHLWLFIEKPAGATKGTGGSGVGASMFLHIPGRLTPNLPGRVLALFKGADLEHLIVSGVATGPKETNRDSRKREDIKVADLPKPLRERIKKTYKGMVSFPPAIQALASIEAKGLLKGALDSFGFPHKDLTLRVGMEQPEYSVMGNDGGDEPEEAGGDDSGQTFYAELIRRGKWSKPFNLAGVTLWDSTVGINTELKMLVSGHGTINKNNKAVLYYNGPFPRQNVPPSEFKDLAFALGAAEISYAQYLNLMLSLQVPTSPGKSLNFINDVGGFFNGAGKLLRDGASKLPLGVLKITHNPLRGYKPKSGDFPPPRMFNIHAIGPDGSMGEGKDERKGPLIALRGHGTLLGKNLADFNGELSRSGLEARGGFGDKIKLGPFGSIGTTGNVSTYIGPDKTKPLHLSLSGDLKAGPLANRSFRTSFNKNGAHFHSPAECATAFVVKAEVGSANLGRLSFDSLPLKVVPKPGMVAECAAKGLKDAAEYTAKMAKKGVQAAASAAKVGTKGAKKALRQLNKAANAAKKAAEAMKNADQAAQAAVEMSFAAVGGVKNVLNSTFKAVVNVADKASCFFKSCNLPHIPGKWSNPEIFTKDIVDLSLTYENDLLYVLRDGRAFRHRMNRDGDGRYRKFQGAQEIKRPKGAALFRIDGVIGSGQYPTGAVALDRNGRVYFSSSRGQPFKPAQGTMRAMDVSASATHIWIARADGPKGGMIMRAPLDQFPNFSWETSNGVGLRVDATRDNRAWILAHDPKSPIKQWRVWEPKSHYNNWAPQQAWGVEITTSSDKTPKIWLTQMASKYGGPLFNWTGNGSKYQQFHGGGTLIAAGRNGTMAMVNGYGRAYLAVNSYSKVE
ncbi:DM9 repeat-containing protein [Magnetospira sp. QH-2]|uniref:DM9 repeat-containing protein n=1 Tax=Magnetospira sp. (strain QH-2) TaxID=1288970 RepID=UPI0003E80AFC|nr:DM9 repeat-containing protein [Magnetospira sp. QH-2]CCQ74212.1 Exported protein of unknown function [Magnetospira sp. QH-2]